MPIAASMRQGMTPTTPASAENLQWHGLSTSIRLLALRLAATVHQRPSKPAPSRFVAVCRHHQDVARRDFTSICHRRCCDVTSDVVATTLQYCRDNVTVAMSPRQQKTGFCSAKLTSATQTAGHALRYACSRMTGTFTSQMACSIPKLDRSR